MDSKKIGTVTVSAREWKRTDQHRIYFSAGNQGSACWDVVNSEWVKVHGEFGARFKGYVKDAFKL